MFYRQCRKDRCSHNKNGVCFVDGAEFDFLGKCRVTYNDNDRYYCFNVNDPDITWTGGLYSRLIHEMFPITMPYMPGSGKYRVAVEEFLMDEKNGDFDTVGIPYIITPDGDRVVVERYFKDGEHSMVEIDKHEYLERKLVAEAKEE